ncbi:MAG: hypothetical protein WCK93_10240, partial [Nitrosomonadales bacterium]
VDCLIYVFKERSLCSEEVRIIETKFFLSTLISHSFKSFSSNQTSLRNTIILLIIKQFMFPYLLCFLPCSGEEVRIIETKITTSTLFGNISEITTWYTERFLY